LSSGLKRGSDPDLLHRESSPLGRGELPHLGSARLERLMYDQRLAMVGDGQATIHVVPKLDPCARVATLPRVEGNCQRVAREGNRVVLGHHALELEAKEILGPSASWPGKIG
jgi:hypothetical protein